jgi:hypothetical protein
MRVLTTLTIYPPHWEHFGSDVIGAIDRAYRFAGRVEGYYLYEPRNEALAP